MSHHEDCEFCRNKFSETVLKEYENWEIQLFLNQYYLGRSIIKLKRHAVDITDLSKNEREELFEKVFPELENAVGELFSPDLYNQATLGNDCRHFHIHFIPRYSSDRELNGEVFSDKNWNEDYRASPTEHNIRDETFEKIEKRIEEELNR